MRCLARLRRAAATLLLLAAPLLAHAAPEMSATDVAAFFDGMLPAELESADIAGAAIAVVKDGQLLFARGYGLADRQPQRPVSADGTLFRIGSVSKLFTWTAVMQLVEAGQLQLDADVQQYLDFPLPPRDGQPVTLRQLMTHTAGFEETIQGMQAQPGEPLDLGPYLKAQLPARLFAAGAVAAYSNYGATLAGYIVERRSGMRFNDYVARHILQPLGMARTTFEQPLPPALAPGMSRGYDLAGGPAQPFETIRVAPAGSASATATDIARFMLANLGDGAVAGTRLLQPATLAAMQAPQWRHHPAGPAMALGFIEDGGHARRVIGHGGDTAQFHSGLYLLPDHQLGLFFVQNSNGKRVLRDAVFRRFLARYLPAAPSPPAAAATASDDVEGFYVPSRRSESSPLRLLFVLSQAHVVRQRDGSLTMSEARAANGQPVRFVPTGQGAWQGADDAQRKLYFRRDAAGRWEMSGRVPTMIWQRVPWYRRADLMRVLLVGSLSCAGLGLLLWPVAAAVRRHYRAAPPPALQRARRAARWAAVLTLLPWTLLALLLASMDVGSSSATIGLWLRAVQAGAWLSLGGIVLAASAARLAWRKPAAGWWARVHGTLLALAALAGVFIAWQGGLMGWDGRY